MNLHQLLPDKIINKAPETLTWLVKAAFAAALPEVYQKMPQDLVTAYFGFTPQKIQLLKYVPAAFMATLAFYVKQSISGFNLAELFHQQQMKCCIGH